MQDSTNATDALRDLARENARLRGEILATGVLLAQLLQSICRTQLNPHAFATKIMKDATGAVEAFKPNDGVPNEDIVKTSALETIRHYDDQIRSVLPI